MIAIARTLTNARAVLIVFSPWPTERYLRVSNGPAAVSVPSGGGIAFTPDGQKIVADAFDGLHVWEVAPPGTIVESDAAQPGTGSAMAVDPGVKTAIVGYQDGSIAGFDVSGARRLGQAFAWETPSLSCAGSTGGPCDAVSPHTDLLADTRSDGTVAIVNLHTLRLATILPDHIGDDDAVAWLPDGRTLVHGELNGELRFWDVTTGRHTRTFRFAGTVEQVTVSHDGKLLAVETQAAHSSSAQVEVIQIATGRVLQTHSLPDGSAGLNIGLEFSRDGRDLVALGTASNVVVWDVRNGRRLWSNEGSNASAMGITPDSRLLGLGTQDGKILFLNLRTGQQGPAFAPSVGPQHRFRCVLAGWTHPRGRRRPSRQPLGSQLQETPRRHVRPLRGIHRATSA